MFLLLNIISDLLIGSISLINPYTSQSVLVEDEESFEICKFNGKYSIIIILIYKILEMFLLLFLIFVEWNISVTMYDMRFILLTIYMNILSIVFIFVFEIIKIKNYILYFVLQTVVISFISISNYILLYGFRLILAFIKKQNIKIKFVNSINEKFINNESQLQTKSTNNNNINSTIYKSSTTDEYGDNGNNSIASKETNFISRMINYHYSNELYDSTSKNSTLYN